MGNGRGGITIMTARPLVAASAALIGAGLIAATPITATSGNAVALRSSDAQVALTSQYSFDADESALSLLGMTATRGAGNLAGAPLVPVVVALAALGGDKEMLYSQLRQVIDAPLAVADPTFEALAKTLPADLGGGTDHDPTTNEGPDGDLMQFRQDLWEATDGTRGGLADALGVNAGLDDNPAADATGLLLKSAENIAKLPIGTPVALVQLAVAIASGESAQNVYKIAQGIVDGPQWAIDPAIEALATVLPETLGGGTNGSATNGGTAGAAGDGAVMQFRNNEMLGLRNQVRVGVANLLKVDVNDDGSVKASTTPVTTSSKIADTDSGTDLRAQLSKQTEKLVTGDNSSVKKRVNEVKGIAKDVGSLKLDSAGNKAGTVVKARVQQAGQDLENGVKKVRETVKKTFSKNDQS